MGNAPPEALKQSEKDLLNASKTFYFAVMKGIDKDKIDSKVLKLLKKTKVNCLWQHPDKFDDDAPSPEIHGLSVSGKKIDLLGKTALHYASAIGSYQIVKVLVNSFTDHDKLVNFMKLQDNDGQTAYDIVSNGKIYDGAKLKELGVTNSKFKMMIGMIDSY